MKISTELREFVVVFHDKSYRYVSKDKADKIMEVSTTMVKNITIDGSFYKFSSIAKIISVEDFRKEYPYLVAKEQESEKPNYTYPDGVPKTKTDYSGKAGEGMLKGIDRYIANNKTTGKAEAMRDLIKKAQRGKSDLASEYKNIIG